MTTQVIKERPVYIGGIDFSQSAHTLGLDYAADEKENTTLSDDTHTYQGGLKSLGFAMDGYWRSDASYLADAALFAQAGSNSNVMTFATSSAAVGEVAYFAQMTQFKYDLQGEIGEVFPYSIDGAAAGSLIRGVFEFNGTDDTSGSSNGIQLGAVAAGQSIYIAVHCTAKDGTSPTLDIELVSDDNGDFSSETTRITLSEISDLGAQIDSLAGAITDDYWRVNYTIGGTDPSFTFVVVIGII